MCFGEKIRALDVFGHPISLTYKGDVRFKTRIGGSFCLIIIIVMGSIFLADML